MPGCVECGNDDGPYEGPDGPVCLDCLEALDDMECPGCGATMRWETSHSRCDSCGFIRPCCEGEPLPG